MKLLFVFAASILSFSAIAEEEDWLGLDAPSGGSMELSLGTYEAGAKSLSVAATIPLVSYSEVHLYFSDYRERNESYDLESKRYSVAWNTDPFQKFVFGVSYELRGQGSDLETEDFSLSVGFGLGDHAQFTVAAVKGESQVSIDGFGPQIEDEFTRLGLDQIDREGAVFTLQYQFDRWGARTYYAHFKNEEAPSASQSELDDFDSAIERQSRTEGEFFAYLIYSAYLNACQQLGLSDSAARTCAVNFYRSQQAEIDAGIDRWVNENLVYYNAHDQKNGLNNYEVGADVYFYQRKNTYSLGWLAYESYISEEFESQVYMSFRREITDKTTFGVLLSYVEDTKDWFGEFSFGVNW